MADEVAAATIFEEKRWCWRSSLFRGLSRQGRVRAAYLQWSRNMLFRETKSKHLNITNTMKKTVYYVGLDVHKESVSIAWTKGSTRAKPVYYGQCGGSNLAVRGKLKKLSKELGVEIKEFKVCYEAGPTGFALARDLNSAGIECVLCSPSRSDRKPGERIKTDKLDAIKIAKDFRNGDITSVRIPPATDEAIRDVSRCRTDAVDDTKRSKQRLKSFLLRNGVRYKGKSDWSASHMGYLRTTKLPCPAHNIVMEEYIMAIDTCQERVKRLTDKLISLLDDWEWAPVVRALMAFRGSQEISAMTIIAELGDLRRFKNPRQLMAFLGVVPSEHSTGMKRSQGAITKCGNSHARWMVIEVIQHARKPPKISKELTMRQKDQSTQVKAIAWRMQLRLYKKYTKLKARRKEESKCVVALAREFCGFLWELQNKSDVEMPPSQEMEVKMS